MEQLKKMDDGTRNAKKANLPKFKEGASSWDKFLWRDYQAAGHRKKQLTSHISGKHKIVPSRPFGPLDFCSGTKRQ
jgi:hypothetical protein